MKHGVIGVDIEGNVEFHLGGVHSDYNTLCGIDACDSQLGHNGVVSAKPGQKITCPHCYATWKRVTAMKVRETSFSEESKYGFSE